jgi:hypothetical protein
MLAFLSAHLAEVVPTTLPLAFVIVDSLLKLMLGQREFHFVGGDMALCGFALFLGTILQQLLRHSTVITDDAMVLAILKIVGVLILWFVILWIGSHKKWGLSLLAGSLGTATFSLCGYSAWLMLEQR